MIHPSTFSMAAFDATSQSWGIVVASKFPAVGAVVPWAKAGTGAIATQAFINTSYGPNGLDLLSQGKSAQETLKILIKGDEGREIRQVGIIDRNGQTASFTGRNCPDWAGSINYPGYTIQGNTLTSSNVLSEMENAFLIAEGELKNKLYAALAAGEKAGGDRRGRQSAAILVVKNNGGYGGFNDRMVDYRVDDDMDPIGKLGELLKLHNLYFGKTQLNEKIQIKGHILIEIQNLLQHKGYLSTTTGNYDLETKAALSAFIGDENFEERCDPEKGLIDKPVYDYILGKFKK